MSSSPVVVSLANIPWNPQGSFMRIEERVFDLLFLAVAKMYLDIFASRHDADLMRLTCSDTV